MRDKRGRRFLHEDLPIWRVRDALNRGEMPFAGDMKIVLELAQATVGSRPGPVGPPSKSGERFAWYLKIEERLLKEKKITINDAIRDVFTSDDGKLDHQMYDRYVSIYDKRGRHSKHIKLARRVVRTQAASAKKYTFPLPAMPRLFSDSFMRAVKNLEKLGE